MFAKKKCLLAITLILSFFLIVPVQALLQQTESQPVGSLPDGQGRELVASLCAQCHALNIVTARRNTKDGWEKSVNDMISRGAQITTDEAKTIVAYLAEKLGPNSPTAPAPAVLASGARDAGAGFPEAPGKEMLMSKCFQCHNEGMWKRLRQDRTGWESTVYRMVGRGALWTEDEINTMAQYLATAFGPKSSEAPQSQRSPR